MAGNRRFSSGKDRPNGWVDVMRLQKERGKLIEQRAELREFEIEDTGNRPHEGKMGAAVLARRTGIGS